MGANKLEFHRRKVYFVFFLFFFFFVFFFFLSRTGLLKSVASPAVMCVKKVVTVSALVVIKTMKKKIGGDIVKTIYMVLMSMERRGPAAGCGDYGLVDSGRTSVKVLKKQR